MSNVSVLGREYTVIFRDYSEDPEFKKSNLMGYCDSRMAEIVICSLSSHPDFADEKTERILIFEKETLRHEIIHAFLFESGLDASSVGIETGWARCEEIVDWFALQGPKVMKAWQEVDAL